MEKPGVRALLFDVFGTVVDWRSSVTREGEEFGRAHGVRDVDWAAFADQWRALYQPAMERVRSGELGFTRLDVLHRWNLDTLFEGHGVRGVPEADVEHFNRAWHRLDPWPDAVQGLARLKGRYIVAAHSNGNIALILNMARRAGLGDLAAARARGLGTAFVQRPTEHGPGQTRDLEPADDWDYVARDFLDLADRLGC